jgi:hypothetical protein
MEVELCRHALDRVPLSLIIDDSAALVNLNYFFLRDVKRSRGRPGRWEDVPVVTPESFTREWAEWCAASGVRGKFSVVPCPAALGRLDHGLPLFGREQLESWLAMCREAIVPSFDITPEMLTHTFVLDLATMAPRSTAMWEQWEWQSFGPDDHVDEYIALSCQILTNVGLPPQGVTSPGGFGGKNLPYYARVVGDAFRRMGSTATPYFFQQLWLDTVEIETPVHEVDRAAGTAVAEIIACTADWTGSWTGYDPVDPDYYVTADLQSGRLPGVIEAGSPAILCSHWQGMYGMHDEDRRGFRTLQTVVERLRQRDPAGERTRWRTCSEIGMYACARALAGVSVEGTTITLDLPVRVAEMTLRLRGVQARGVEVGPVALREVGRRRDFEAGTYLREGDGLLVAFDARQAGEQLQVYVRTGA